MKKLSLLIFALFIITGCAIQQRYYLKSNLNSVSIGQTKQELFNMFPGEKNSGGAPPLLIRGAQESDGSLIEVGEVVLTDGVSPTVPYWFLFENGRLVQWGQPEDWKEVKARYEISYNPSQGISR